MAELAFNLGSGAAVVGDPGGVSLADAGVGEDLLVGTHGHRAPAGGRGALRAQWARGAGRREVGGTAAGAGRPDRGGDPARAGHSASAEVDVELVLAEQPARRGRCLGLAAVLDPGLVKPIVERPGAVGIVAVDARPLGVLGCTCARLDRRRLLVARRVVIEKVGDEVFGDAGVAGVAWGYRGGGDDLRVRVDRGVALVAIEPARGALVPVPGIRVHGGYHPVLRDPPRDPEHRVQALIQILAQYRGQQRRRLLHRLGQLATIQQREHREPIPGPGGDQLLAGGPVVPVDLRLAVAGVVVPLLSAARSTAASSASVPASTPRTAERINVTVSIVATASYSGVESSTRRRPTSPPACAASRPTSKIRPGRA